MNKTKPVRAAIVLAAALSVAGCGSGSGGDAPAAPVADSVPASAVTSVGAFVAFMKSLVLAPDDRGEPLEVNVTPPVDDTAEPDPSV